MKKGLALSFAIATLSFATMSYADIFMHTNPMASCGDVVGKWTGVGQVSSWVTGTCTYHGAGQLTNVDAAGNFTLDLAVDKDSGGILCPGHSEDHLNGRCTDGKVTLQTKYGHLEGMLDGRSGTAKGTLTLALGVKADVDIQLKKVS
jgi:hypothetical protein